MKIKGMVVYDGRTWTAMSLAFGLAAQAFSAQEAMAKLATQIEDYIDEAQGQDAAFQVQLLQRKAPFAWYVRYYWLAFKNLGKANGSSSPLFCQSTHDSASHA